MRVFEKAELTGWRQSEGDKESEICLSLENLSLTDWGSLGLVSEEEEGMCSGAAHRLWIKAKLGV